MIEEGEEELEGEERGRTIVSQAILPGGQAGCIATAPRSQASHCEAGYIARSLVAGDEAPLLDTLQCLLAMGDEALPLVSYPLVSSPLITSNPEEMRGEENTEEMTGEEETGEQNKP